MRAPTHRLRPRAAAGEAGLELVLDDVSYLALMLAQLRALRPDL